MPLISRRDYMFIELPMAMNATPKGSYVHRPWIAINIRTHLVQPKIQKALIIYIYITSAKCNFISLNPLSLNYGLLINQPTNQQINQLAVLTNKRINYLTNQPVNHPTNQPFTHHPPYGLPFFAIPQWAWQCCGLPVLSHGR